MLGSTFSECRPTRRGSTFTLGEKAWLDGFDGSNDKGVFFAASLRDHSIYLLKWKSQPIRKAPVVTEFPTRPSSVVSTSSDKSSAVTAGGVTDAAGASAAAAAAGVDANTAGLAAVSLNSSTVSNSVRSPPDEDEGSFNLVTGPPIDNAIHRDQQLLSTPLRQSRTPTRSSLAAQVFDMPEDRDALLGGLSVRRSREGSGEPGVAQPRGAAAAVTSQSLSVPAGTSRSSSSSPNSSCHRNRKSSRSVSPYESDI